MQCECCNVEALTPATPVRFSCACMGKILCKTCNHCLDHCHCPDAPEPELPYPMQVGEIRDWWWRQGMVV